MSERMAIFVGQVDMDILRKELTAVYAAQHLEREHLCAAMLEETRADAAAAVRAGGACVVITDVSTDRCYIGFGSFGPLMGLGGEPYTTLVVDSSDEDEIYNRIHPEDLVEKRMLEYELFRRADSLPPRCKTALKATCRIRMKDSRGNYRAIDNSTQIARLSGAGKIWLIRCCYDFSPDTVEGGISPRIVDYLTGEVTTLQFSERRTRLLSAREKQIMRLIEAGKPSKQIADILGISIHTVNRHRQNIIAKLSVGNSIEALMAAKAMRLL